MAVVLTDKVVRTRKPHKCWGCSREFPKGTRMWLNVIDEQPSRTRGRFVRNAMRERKVITMKLIDAGELILGISRKIDTGLTICDVLEIIKAQPAAMEWHKITRRELTEEEKEEYGKATECIVEGLPDYGEEVLVTNGVSIWIDSFDEDYEGVYLSGTGNCADDVKAWMPMVTPYKESEWD